MLNIIFAFFVILHIHVTISVQDNVIAYNKMPPLYEFDDYNKCVNGATASSLSSSSSSATLQLSPALYCMVFSKIQKDNSSPLWLHIEKYSNITKHYYRHDHLQFGVCMKRCEQFIWQTVHNNNSNNNNNKWIGNDNLQHNEIDDNNEFFLFIDGLRFNYSWDSQLKLPVYTGCSFLDLNIINYYNKAYGSEKFHRLKYQQLINNCLNYEFQLQYKLQLQTYIEYCITANTNPPWFEDNIGKIFCLIIITIIMANLLSTLYDYYLKQLWQSNRKQHHMDFYKMELNNSKQRFLTSFSICRNYYKLVKPLGLTDFEMFNGIRVFCLFLVIMAHVVILFVISPLKNPQYIESLIKHRLTIILQNGSVILQIYFFMSGFLLKYKFERLKAITTRTTFSNCLKTFSQIFIGRYLRFSIPVLFLILFHVTIAIKLGDGPYWKHIMLGEIEMCRKYWWKNLFMINNFLFKESCSHHTWYLAADLQLHTFFSIMLILMARFPNIKYHLYGILGTLSIIVPFIVTWFLHLDGAFHATPESYRYLFFKDAATLYESYMPCYTNMGSYVCGIIFMDFYFNNARQQKHQLKQLNEEKETNEKKQSLKKLESTRLENSNNFKYFCGAIYPAWLLLLFSGLLLSENVLKKPFGTALYDALYRNLWSLVTFCAFYGLFFKFNYNLYNALTLSIWRPLARVSYQAYVWHIVILRGTFGSIQQPIDVNFLQMVYFILRTFIITMIVAFLIVLLLEAPLEYIIRIICNKETKQQQQKHQRDVSHHNE